MNAMQMRARERTPEEWQRAKEAFLDEIGPMQELMVRITSMLPPAVRYIEADGTLRAEPVPPNTPLMQAYEEYVRSVAARHGIEVPQ
jgi:hypothetical protein